MTRAEIEDALTDALFDLRQRLPAQLGIAIKIDEMPGLVKVRLSWGANLDAVVTTIAFALGVACGWGLL